MLSDAKDIVTPTASGVDSQAASVGRRRGHMVVVTFARQAVDFPVTEGCATNDVKEFSARRSTSISNDSGNPGSARGTSSSLNRSTVWAEVVEPRGDGYSREPRGAGGFFPPGAHRAMLTGREGRSVSAGVTFGRTTRPSGSTRRRRSTVGDRPEATTRRIFAPLRGAGAPLRQRRTGATPTIVG